jgi:hypothetical protein
MALTTRAMRGTCEVCGNEYERCIKVSANGKEHLFDCFECAIHALAPKCEHCGIRIVGHGVEKGQRIFCGAHCAQAVGVNELRDSA